MLVMSRLSLSSLPLSIGLKPTAALKVANPPLRFLPPRVGFDNPEPSSPKVTCIGQVEMKTKKKVSQTRSLSNRSVDNVNFRKLEQAAPEERGLVIQNNQKSSSGVQFQSQDHEESVTEEKGRVSICIPPKNALLLMRCRSDPMKMADITNRFWESPTRKETDEEVEKEDKKEIGVNVGVEELVDTQKFECKVPEEASVSVDCIENEENLEAVKAMEMEIESSTDEEKFKCGELTTETEQEDEEKSEIKALVAVEVNSIEQVPDSRVREPEKEEEDSSIKSYSSFSENSNEEYIERENEGIVAGDDATLEVVEKDNDEKFKSMIEKLIEEALLLENIDGEVVQEAKSEAVISEPEKKEIKNEYMTDVEHPTESIKQQNESILPDCLLLMMYEPKLSMEVSKETWVCSSNTENKKEIFLSEESNKSQHLPPQPPRSSCSFPDTMSMATMIEQN
ncbi:hypothetical protein CQW23_29739 [Capsicum baccatum]|uniref:Uncharacterized protein n=1 Tax=Capsicum baccatum TaxID=33114 RepID=A0A2G2VCE5_CAPBA|nr:hypothetical protein CQW23_29739 [Capsicum baccatum]